MEGKLKFKMVILLVAACWATAAAGQVLECQSDEQCRNGVGYYCDHAYKCRKCLSCEELNRKPSLSHKPCITSVVDCGDCIEGLAEEAQGLRCVRAAPPAYVWVLIAAGGLLLFGAAVAIVVYVLRNTHTFRVFTSARTSLQPGGSGASAPPELPPPPYNTLYSPVRPASPAAPPLPPHFVDEEAARPFMKYPPPPAPALESAGNQEANVYNNPSYVRGPHLPSNSYHAAEHEPEPEYLHDETTAESPWRPGDAASTAGDNSESGSSGGAASGAGAGAGGGGGAGAASLSALLAAERATTLVRPPRQDAATPSKVPRLRQDSNNNRNSRERDMEEMPRPPPAGAATFNILVNVQQVNDVKL